MASAQELNDLKLCRWALDPDGSKQLQQSGVVTELLEPKASAVLGFIQDFRKQYGDFPTLPLVEQKTGVNLPSDTSTLEPIPYLVSEARNGFLYRHAAETVMEAASLIEHQDTERAAEKLLNFRNVTVVARRGKKDRSPAGMIETVLDRYEKSEFASTSGRMVGISTPWDVLNTAMRGFRPGHLVSIVARPKVGKTTALCLIGAQALREGKKVLMISMEMEPETILSRLLLMYGGLSLHKYWTGQLGGIQKKKLIDLGDRVRDGELEGTHVLTPEEVRSVEDVSLAILDYEPDIVLIDGLYILGTEERHKSNWEKVMSVVTILKNYALAFEVPIITTTQFNRKQKQTAVKGSINEIAFADSVGMFCDLVIGMFRDEEADRNKQMIFRILASREFPPFDWASKWNLDRMDFSFDGFLTAEAKKEMPEPPKDPKESSEFRPEDDSIDFDEESVAKAD